MSGPGDVVLTLLDNLVERVLTGQPQRTDGKPVARHTVYSHLRQGRSIDPTDYRGPWSPTRGSTLQDDLEKRSEQTAADGSNGSGDEKKKAASQAKFQKAIDAAFHTAELVDTLLRVTPDGTYDVYQGGGKRLSSTYEGIVNAMQPVPAPPLPDDLQRRVDQAKAVLYVLDDEGEIEERSPAYTRYLKNSRAFAQAKADFAVQQAMVLSDPNKADMWPLIAAPLQQAVDDAWDALKTQGAEKIEAAIDTIESVGVNIGARMVARARQQFDAWDLSLAGVPVKTQYAYIEPNRWYDHEETDIGFTKLTVTQSDAETHVSNNTSSFAKTFSESHSQSTNAAGTVHFGMFALGGGGGGGTQSTDTGGSSGSNNKHEFHNTAKDLSITLEWGLCDIHRPGISPDLFWLNNWYLPGERSHCVSDGTIEGQVGQDKQLLPMITEQFLVVRNVVISSTDWGADGTTLANMYAENQEHTDSTTGTVKVGGAFSVGWLSAGGGVEHSWSDSHGTTSSSTSGSTDDQQKWHFANNVLSIPGTQIVGFVSSILPPAPTIDDPGLDEASDSTTESSTSDTVPAGAPA
jgi:hypothetical protein